MSVSGSLNMTDTQEDFLESDFLSVIKECIKAIGGPKKVGYILMERQIWEPVEDPGKVVTDCVNAKLRRKFGPEEIEVILLEARKVDCHLGMAHLLLKCFYQPPVPISPQEKISALTNSFEKLANKTSQQLKEIEMEIRRAREEFGAKL